jgi:tetratricopeptide (TPR) repeat protein
MELFDSTAALIPIDDLDIVDLRAERLKKLNKKDGLNQLVICALNSDEANPNAWLAFSHLLELNNDAPRALQAARKALRIDPNLRRAHMHYGELRRNWNDIKKALAAFIKAHQLHESMDSYQAIVHCLCQLPDWEQAESYAARASVTFAFDSDEGAFSMTMMGLALRGRDVARAIRLLKRSLEKGGRGDRDALTALVEMRLKQNDLDGAEGLLKQYRKVAGEFEFFMKMAIIARKRRDFLGGIEFARNAAYLDPSSEEARKLLEQLESMIRETESETEDEEDTISF